MRAAPLMSPAKMGTDVRVLVIEDHEQTAKLLQRGLNEVGFVVDVCTDGLDGLQMAVNTQYDLLILDVMLPTLDGWMILAGFRERDRDTPALILSARESVDDRVRGLSLGADDYLVKPFAFAELIARVHSVLRRSAGTIPEVLRIADLELDYVRQRAVRAGNTLDLSPKEFALLGHLARRAGEPQTRAMLAHDVWDMPREGESNVVDVSVRRLRSKVDDPFERKLIHTVRGVGYVFRAD